MNSKKDGSMKSEALQWACELESLGHRVLAQCEHCPEDLLGWSPPYLGLSSLSTLAIQIIQEIERWVLIPVGGRRLVQDENARYLSQSTFADLTAFYEEWIHQIHQILDYLPNAFLDLYVGSRFGASANTSEAKVPTVRMCLFKAIEHCAILLGQIEVTRQLVPDKEVSHVI